MTTGYAVPIFLMNPYLAGSLFLDYVTRGRFPSVPVHPPILAPDELSTLQSPYGGVQEPESPVPREPAMGLEVPVEVVPAFAGGNATMKGILPGHE